MNRPILIVVLGYIIGIIIGLYCKISIALFFPIVFLILVLMKKYIINNKNLERYYKLLINKKLLIIFAVSVFVSNSVVLYLNNQYEQIYKLETKETFTATVISEPVKKEYYTRYKIKVKSTSKNELKDTTVFLNINNDIELEYGERISFLGEYKAPEVSRNYKGFSYRNYLKSIGICGTINASDVKSVGQDEVNVIDNVAHKVKKYIKKKLENNISNNDNRNLLLGILIGEDDEISDEISEIFSDSSLSHILAVSGMHVAYIIMFITVLFKKLKIRKKIGTVISIAFLIFFIFLAGQTPSVQRACIMMILTLLASLIYRKSDIINNISISLLILLIQNPFYITNTGLILSFVATIGIIVMNKLIKNNDDIQKNTDKHVIKQKIKNIIFTSLEVQIFIFPITILIFNKLSLTFFISNLIISGFIGIVLMIGFISIVIDIPILYKILNLLLQFMIMTAKVISNIPISKIIVITPNSLTIILYYIIMFFVLYIKFLKKKKYKRIIEKKILTFVENLKICMLKNVKKLITIFIILIVLFQLIKVNFGDLKIYFIDVGQGDSSLIVTPNNKKILIDGGGSINKDGFDVGKQTLLPYILDRKIKTIDYLIISHFDSDHVRTDY